MAKKKYSKPLSFTIPDQYAWVKPLLFAGAAVLLFFLVCLCVKDTIKQVSMGMLLAALAVIFCSFRTLRERIHLPMLMVFALVLMSGFATLTSVAPNLAIYEFLKPAFSACLAVLLLASVPQKSAAPGRTIASLLATGTAIAGFLSIDLISTRFFSGAAQSLLGVFTHEFNTLHGVEDGIRITSFFSNTPNVFAGCMALGVLLSLSLSLSSETKRERIFHLVLLYINSLSFVLAFSMGATASILAAFVVFLFLERKERRLPLFVLMAETLVLVMIAVFPVSMTSFATWNGVQPIPLLCTLAGAAALCVADLTARDKLTQRNTLSTKTLAILLAGVGVLMATFCVLAYHLTGEVTLTAGNGLRRAIYPDSGAYTLTASGGEGMVISVTSQNREDTMMHTSSLLYTGALEGAAFTVPEDSMVVYIDFYAVQDTTLHSLTYSGASEGRVPLDYALLPGFIANRLQGIWANQNAIQRLVFFEDGLKLFIQSPLTGLGLGAFENNVRSVQDFSYVTIYAHNHYIQVLVEMGILGLLIFLGLLASCGAAIWFARKRETFSPLLPGLGAALVFMAAHATNEVDFSFYPFVPFAFGVFALIDICCGDAIPKLRPGSITRSAALIAFSGIIAVSAILVGSNLYARKITKEEYTFEVLKKAADIDPFEWSDHAIAYIGLSMYIQDDPDVWQQADAYAAKLAELDSVTINMFVAQYYFAIGQTDTALVALEKYVNFAPADPDAWHRAFDLLASYPSDTDVYRTGVEKIFTLWKTWNEQHMGNNSLTEANIIFLTGMGLM